MPTEDSRAVKFVHTHRRMCNFAFPGALGCFVSEGKETAKNMCCIDCRNQKCVLNPTRISNIQGNQENRHRCATLADLKRGLLMLNAYYSNICLDHSSR